MMHGQKNIKSHHCLVSVISSVRVGKVRHKRVCGRETFLLLDDLEAVGQLLRL